MRNKPGGKSGTSAFEKLRVARRGEVEVVSVKTDMSEGASWVLCGFCVVGSSEIVLSFVMSAVSAIAKQRPWKPCWS